MGDNAVLLHENIICDHYIYESVWSPTLGEIVSVDRKHGNTHDCHAICQLKGGLIISHAPRELAEYFWFFFGHSGS